MHIGKYSTKRLRFSSPLKMTTDCHFTICRDVVQRKCILPIVIDNYHIYYTLIKLSVFICISLQAVYVGGFSSCRLYTEQSIGSAQRWTLNVPSANPDHHSSRKYETKLGSRVCNGLHVRRCVC